ncbi:MAG: hypothetical protein EBT85_01230 [Synechococcaceae bacterium WB5_2B_268]|nr:hypothetical protein [Synechococcaceae bacterium WB5_2B_268]
MQAAARWRGLAGLVAGRCGRRKAPVGCRGVHRPAAAALRSEAGGVVVGIVALPRLRWPGSWLPVFGCGDAPFFLARLRGHCTIRP